MTFSNIFIHFFPTYRIYLCWHATVAMDNKYSTQRRPFLRKLCALIEIIERQCSFESCKKMAKATTVKDALKRWEDQTKKNSTECTEIGLQFQWPPIEKLDNTLSTLVNCE